jgi:L-cysteate sulfo-lyase
VVTFGAVQSNHARQTAAACARQGLPCHLLLARKVPWQHPRYESAGNLLLDQLLGAEVRIVDPAAMATERAALLQGLESRGLLPYLIPVGGSNALGAMGYARCALELQQQAEAAGFRLTDVMHASSSAGTQAGLIAGFAGLALDGSVPVPRVHGINVSETDPAALPAAVLELAQAVVAERGLDLTLGPDAVLVDNRYLGAGYGIPNAATAAAIRRLAATEGVVMDPVYSGKGFSALLDRVRLGEFAGVSNLVYIHTGGAMALAVYDDAFA